MSLKMIIRNNPSEFRRIIKTNSKKLKKYRYEEKKCKYERSVFAIS